MNLLFYDKLPDSTFLKKNACAFWFIGLMNLCNEGNIPFRIFAPLTLSLRLNFAYYRFISEGKLIIIFQRTATKSKNASKDQTIPKEHKSLEWFEK